MTKRQQKTATRASSAPGPRLLLDIRSNTIQAIISHARQIEYLSRCLHECLEAPARQHCVVANHTGDLITVLADSPVWASKLRYLASHIASHLSACLQGKPDLDIRITVRPPDPATPQDQSHPNPLSAESARLICEIADTMEDGRLKTSLLRLAGRKDKN